MRRERSLAGITTALLAAALRSCWKPAAAIVVVAVIATWGWQGRALLEVGKAVTPDRPPPACVVRRGIVGVQDIAALGPTHFVASATTEARDLWNQSATRGARGGLWFVSVMGSNLYPIVAADTLPLSGLPDGVAFNPGGIFFHRNTRELYVINHAYDRGGERVDVFELTVSVDRTAPAATQTRNPRSRRNSGLSGGHQHAARATGAWRRVISSNLFRVGALHDLVVSDQGQLYVSVGRPYAGCCNRRTVADEYWYLFGVLSFSRRTGVVTCDPDGRCAVAAWELPLAAGVGLDPTGRLWVTDVSRRTASVYDVTAVKGRSRRGRAKVRLLAEVPLPHSVWRLELDADSGRFYGAATPKLLAHLEWVSGRYEGPAPVAVVALDIAARDARAAFVLQGDEDDLDVVSIGSVSAAVIVPGTSLVLQGGTAGDGIALCDVPKLRAEREQERRRKRQEAALRGAARSQPEFGGAGVTEDSTGQQTTERPAEDEDGGG